MNFGVILVYFATVISCGYCDNFGCPHRNEARTLIHQQLLIAPAPSEDRLIIDVEIPREVIGRNDLSCITVVANQQGSTPDFISFGRNRFDGYSIIVHSRIRNPLNATLFVYST